ncbi:tetratricopeptide repeat protein [bacterium]|nr:tetratricopeptide repeat protein [bacterium]MBU4133803.1 tetratricopeptide repeat protein [bacterium]
MKKVYIFMALSALVFISSCAGVRIFKASPLKIASSFESGGNLDEAVAVLKNAAVEPGLKPAAKREILTALAGLYEKKKDPLNAIKTLREANQIKPDDPFIRLRLAELFLKEGLIDEALAEYTAVEKRGAETPSLLAGLGEAYYRKGHFLQASEYLDRYLKLYPDDKKALLMLYESYEASGNYPASRNALSGCAAILAEDDFALRMAMNWMRDGNPDEAIEELEKITAKYPKGNFYLALAYYQKGDLNKALEFFSKATPELSDESSFFNALVLFELGRKDEAYPIFKKLSVDGKYSAYCAVFE